MSNVLFLQVAEVAAPSVKFDGVYKHDGDAPFLSFNTLSFYVDGIKSSAMYTVLDRAVLQEQTFLRQTWMRKDVLQYMADRSALINLSKSRLCLSPTLEANIGARTKVLIIDEIFMQEPVREVQHFQSVLAKFRQEYGAEHLIVCLDWAYLIESVQDRVIPHPSVFAAQSGYTHTGLLWYANDN